MRKSIKKLQRNQHRGTKESLADFKLCACDVSIYKARQRTTTCKTKSEQLLNVAKSQDTFEL